jgi:hypothetical protein
MIYQLANDLRINFPGEIIVPNKKAAISPSYVLPDRLTRLYEYSGKTEPRTRFTVQPLNILCRDIDPAKARKLSYDIFEYLNDKFSVTLSGVTVDGVLYPNIFILQISGNAPPSLLGEDDNGRSEFTTNYRIIYRRT